MSDITAKDDLSRGQRCKLKEFGDRINKFGANFALCDADGEVVLLCESDSFKSSPELLTQSALWALNQEEGLCRVDEENPVLAAVI